VRAKDERRGMLGGSALSIVLHLLLALAVLFYWPQRGGKSGARSAQHSTLIISLDRGPLEVQPSALAPARAADKAEPLPPKTVPERVQPLAPAAAPKPRVDHRAKAPVPAQAALASGAAVQKSQAEVDAEADNDALLQGIRARWLQPPKTGRDFHCRIKIDYQSGGMISAVTVQEGCGGALLDDSVERAIWKAQPLSIKAAHTQGGNLIIDFSP